MFEPQQEQQRAAAAPSVALTRPPPSALPQWDDPEPDSVETEIKNLRIHMTMTRISAEKEPHLLAALEVFRRLESEGRLKEASALYAQKDGTSLLNDLLALFRFKLDIREEVTLKLSSLGQTLDWHAFLEQLAIGAAYAQRDDLSDAKGGDGDTDLGAVIKAAGFTSRPLIRGRWGLQFRIFEPTGKVAKGMHRLPIIAFRGTEGVRSPFNDPLTPATREGMVDTYVGDLTRMGAGYPQFQANRALIERRAKALGKSVMTGHSLGGGLAQIATAKLPQYTAECVTFAAPGIDADDAKGLEDKRIPTTHHRTEGDIVPVAGDRAAPGEIVTYERYASRDGGEHWQGPAGQGSMPTNHNTTPIRGFLRGTSAASRTDFEKTLLDRGMASPAETPGMISRSTVSRVLPTNKDNVRHLGNPMPLPGVTQKVFRANLGYNLLVEYVEAEVAKLDPAKRSRAQIDEALTALSLKILTLGTLPMSAEAHRLYQDTGTQSQEMGKESVTRGRTLRVGQPIEVNQKDRALVAFQVGLAWDAWWPGQKR